MYEVEVGTERLGDCFVVGKLFPVVRGQGMNLVGERCQQFQHGLFDAFGFFAWYFGNQRQPLLTLGQRDDGLYVTFDNDRVELPVTQARATFHDGGTLLDRNPVAQVGRASHSYRSVSCAPSGSEGGGVDRRLQPCHGGCAGRSTHG